MPARRRQRSRQKITKKPQLPKKVKLFLVGIVALLFLVICFIILISSKAIDLPKYSVVYSSEGAITVVVYDFDKQEVTKISVPADTYISSAYGFGDWRMGSLLKLGKQEGYDGELLRLSLVKSLHFPVDAWVEGELPSSNIFQLSRVIGQNSSLNLRQRMQLALFVFRTPAQNWFNIDLSHTSFISEEKLPDGDNGFLVSRQIPPQLGTIFTIPTDDKIVRIGIYDRTDKKGTTIRDLTEGIHILGGDWAIIEQSAEDTECVVKGNNPLIVNRISTVFVCEVNTSPVEGNFDVEMIVGNKFKERF